MKARVCAAVVAASVSPFSSAAVLAAAPFATGGVAAPLAKHMADCNRHDAKALAAGFAEDAKLYIGNGDAVVSGRAAIEKFYADFFPKNRVTSRVVARSLYGNYMVDRERLTFNGHVLCCVGSVYEMRGALIQSTRFYMADQLLRKLTGS
jgi:hypothetical protein